VTEDTKYHPPEIPLVQAATSFEKTCSAGFIASLVFSPSFTAVSHRIVLLLTVRRVRFEAPRGQEAREDEDRLDSQLFEYA
jgi:hypothetical protein